MTSLVQTLEATNKTNFMTPALKVERFQEMSKYFGDPWPPVDLSNAIMTQACK